MTRIRAESWAIVTLMALVLVLLMLNLLQAETAARLIAINQGLLKVDPHPVHDCQITGFGHGDGSVTVWVNGWYPHTLIDVCRAGL